MTALAALDASWLFVAGVAAGSVAVAAAIRVARGEWAGPLLPIAEAGAQVFPAALAIAAVLAVAAAARAVGAGEAGLASLARIAARPLAAGLLVFPLGARFVAMARSAADPARVRGAGAAYLAGYTVGLSLWAALATERAPGPAVAVVPACFVVGAFLSGLAWVALVAAARGAPPPDARHDLGKLLFAFASLWAYLVWSLFLPTWYANVPEESRFLLARWTGAPRSLSIAVIVSMAAALCVLFPERLKRRRATLGAAAALVLVALWLERFLLVLPSLAHPTPGG